MIIRKLFEFVNDVDGNGSEIALIEVKDDGVKCVMRYRLKIYRELSNDEIESIVDFVENHGCEVLAIVNRGMFALIFDEVIGDDR